MEEIPFNEEAENIILGNIIEFDDAYDSVASYLANGEVFHQAEAKLLLNKIKSLKKEGISLDLITVCNSLLPEDTISGLNVEYITKCTTNSTTSGMTEHYGKQIYEKYLLRKIIDKTTQIKDKASSNLSNAHDTLIETHNLLGGLISLKPSQKFDITDSVDSAITDISSRESNLISTGYESVDRFAGGLTRGEVSIIGGRPGHGKTTYMLNLLSRMLDNGYRVMLFNRELPNVEVMKKLICLESESLSYSMIRKGVYDDKGLSELDRVRKKILDKYNEGNFVMFDNIRDFSSSAIEVKKFKPDIIFDDYIQLIALESKLDRRFQIEKLVNDYKWMAKEQKAAVILASQLNRNVEYRGNGGRPQLSDLAESGAIEQVAENVLFVYYEYKVNPKSDLGRDIITLCARKVRYGQTGDIHLGYKGDKCKVYNNEKEAEQEEQIQKTILPFD
jgi:replicative DNA helicase